MVVLPYPGNGVLADPEPFGQRPGRPVRRGVIRGLFQCDPHHLSHRPFRQPRSTAPALGDHPHPGHTQLAEPPPPPPHCVGVDPRNDGRSPSLATPSAAHNSALAWTTPRCGSDVERAIFSNEPRCSLDTDKRRCALHDPHPTPPDYFNDGPLARTRLDELELGGSTE